LVPFGHFQANVPAPVNNVKPQYKHLGCVLCVLADYRGTTVTNLLANLDESQRQFAMTTYQGGLHDAGQILAHLSPMGIQDEGFPSYQAFRTTIEEADAVPEWEGALGFGRHIIRASWHGGRLRLWDPQLGVENPAIPTGVPVTLYTFSVLN
jgi:hypothetical protein